MCSFQSNDPTLPVCPAIERTFLLVSASHNYKTIKKLKQVSLLNLRGEKTNCTVQLTFTCSNPTIETLEKGVKYVQS